MGQSDSNTRHYNVHESMTCYFPEEKSIFDQLINLRYCKDDYLNNATINDLDNIIRSLFFNKDETRLQILYCIFGNLYANCFKKNDESTIKIFFVFCF